MDNLIVYSGGIDFGRKVNDTASVILAFDRSRRVYTVVDLSVLRMEWNDTTAYLNRLYATHACDYVIVDGGGVGDALLRSLKFPHEGIVIGSSGLYSHEALFLPLAEVINTRRLVVPDRFKPILLPQLVNLTASATPKTRKLNVQARKGQDDAAFALAFAVLASRRAREPGSDSELSRRFSGAPASAA